jgi:NitT/TauT family transport system substrate-binding protein
MHAHHGWRQITPLNLLTGVALIFLAAGLGTWWTLSQPIRKPLRVAINPWPGYEFATLAAEKGFFDDEGVEVQLVELSSLGDARRAFERGQVDGFFGTIVETLLSRERSDRRAQIALVNDYSAGADVILARAPIRSVEDLRGKRVAIETGSLTAIVLVRALELSGMSWDDVIAVPIAAIDMPASYASGEVDAVVTYAPLSLQVSELPETVEIFSTKSIPGEIVDILAFDEQVLRERAGDVRAFSRAFHRAQDYAREHQAEAYRIMAARQRITPRDFASAIQQGIELVDRDSQGEFLRPAGKLFSVTKNTARILRELGQLQTAVEPSDLIANIAQQ